MSTGGTREDLAFWRRCVLAGVVAQDRVGPDVAADQLDPDLDDDPDAGGVHLPGCTPLRWSVVGAWAGPLPAPLVGTGPRPALETAEDGARTRVRDLLLAHVAAHRTGTRRVPLAVPVDAARHPGPGWVSRRVPGGAVDLGVGVVVDEGPRERTLPLPRSTAAAAGLPPHLGPADRARLEEVGALAAARLARDSGARGGGVLRPVGGCDVPTLLASASLRAHLVGDGHPGVAGVLRGVAVPHRDRGWFDLARVDPAYAGAAWAATDLRDRGFRRPVLVTREELALAPARPGTAARALAGD